MQNTLDTVCISQNSKTDDADMLRTGGGWNSPSLPLKLPGVKIEISAKSCLHPIVALSYALFILYNDNTDSIVKCMWVVR